MTILIIVLLIIAFFASPFVVAGILIFPFAAIITQRQNMLKHLYKTADLCGYSVRPLHKHVSFSRNLSDRYDLLIENDEEAYVIKLWSAKKSDSTLVINKNGTVYESSVVPGGLSSNEHYVVTGKAKPVPVTRENFRVKKVKRLEKVLLYYPENARVEIDLGNKRVPLIEGQKVFGKTVLTPKTFEARLRSRRAPKGGITAVTANPQ